MAKFTVNSQRYDPYKNFKFRVVWDGRPVAGVSKVSGLRRATDVVEYREGGDASTVYKIPGRTKYDAITLERGVTQDLDFEKSRYAREPREPALGRLGARGKSALALVTVRERGA